MVKISIFSWFFLIFSEMVLCTDLGFFCVAFWQFFLKFFTLRGAPTSSPSRTSSLSFWLPPLSLPPSLSRTNLACDCTHIFDLFVGFLLVFATSLLCLMEELDGRWLWLLVLLTGDRWQVTGDRWHATRQTWQKTCDTWHNTYFYLLYIYIFFAP